MTTRVYAVLSRTVPTGGNPPHTYDEGELDFTDHSPVWILATEDNDNFTIHQFDDAATQTWVPTTVVHRRDDIRNSLFAVFDINGMAMADAQITEAEERAAIAVSPRVVAVLGHPDPTRPTLHLVVVLSFFPDHRVRLGDGTELYISMDRIALVDAPAVASYADLQPNDRADCETYMAAYVAALAPAPPHPVPRAPKARQPLPAPAAQAPAPPARPKGPQLPAALKVPAVPPPGQNAKKIPAPPPHANPPPGYPVHQGAHFGGRTSRPVTIKYTFQGELRQADGVFVDDITVRWNDGSTTPWPPQWPGTTETELHIGQPTGTQQRPPGVTQSVQFDVFLADSYLPFLIEDSVETLMNTISEALRTESDRHGVTDSVRMTGARRQLKLYLKKPEVDDIDPEDPDSMQELRQLHLGFIGAWAEQQGLNERAIVDFVEKKTSARTNFLRQAIAEARTRGGRPRREPRRGGRGGRDRGGRGGGRDGGPRSGGCYICGGNHFQRDCPVKTDDAPSDGTPAVRGRGLGFRGGRGSGLRGNASRSHS